MPERPKIYALLVGINGYDSKPLEGCIHDIRAVRAYLESMYDADRLRILELTDEDAVKTTRQGIIDGFGLFADATGADTCLFYFSGHGSYAPASETFAGTNGWVQSFVCLDSRLPGGKDLLDKEMAFLIWKATMQSGGADFIAITDCCHSGTITKAIADSSNVTERMHPPAAGRAPIRPEDCLGYGDRIAGQRAYLEDVTSGNIRKIRMAQAAHIHIAACGASQTAKELLIHGRQQGAFTYSLLKSLYAYSGKAAYGDLMQQVSVAVRNIVADQQPLINFNGKLQTHERLRQQFLSQDGLPIQEKHLLYRHTSYGWSLAAGIISQVFKGDKVIVEEAATESVVLASPEPDVSIIQSKLVLESLPEPIFARVERSYGQSRLDVSFTDDTPEQVRNQIRLAFGGFTGNNVQLTEGKAGQFYIRADRHGRAYLAYPGTDKPMFAPQQITDGVAALHFVEQLAHMQRWLYVKDLNNPSSSMAPEAYALELYVGADDELPEHPAPTTYLSYRELNGEWTAPSIRVAVVNHTTRRMWVSNVYMGFDFSIFSQYFRIMEIPPGQKHWLVFDYQGNVSESIQLQIEAKYKELGYNQITEYLKLFISTGNPIETDKFDQAGVDLPPKDQLLDKSATGQPVEAILPDKADWRTETLGLCIHDPRT